MLVWNYIQLDPIGSHHIPFNPIIKKTTLWLFNIAIEHGPFSLILTIKNDDEVFKHGDFPVRYILRIPSEIPCNPAKSHENLVVLTIQSPRSSRFLRLHGTLGEGDRQVRFGTGFWAPVEVCCWDVLWCIMIYFYKVVAHSWLSWFITPITMVYGRYNYS
jgi:hypothetical protein